jgi:hypothetical protein
VRYGCTGVESGELVGSWAMWDCRGLNRWREDEDARSKTGRERERGGWLFVSMVEVVQRIYGGEKGRGRC